MTFSKKVLAAAGVILIALCCVSLIFTGRSYTLRCGNLTDTENADSYTVEMERVGTSESLGYRDKHIENDSLLITFYSDGKSGADTFVTIKGPDDYRVGYMFYVHRFGIITEGGYLGHMRGGIVIPLAVLAYMLMLLAYFSMKYRRDVSMSLYRYSNITDLGIIVFLVIAVFLEFGSIIGYTGLEQAVHNALSQVSAFTWITFPVALVLSVLVTLSSIDLMRKEGRSWRNMLGCILGIMLLTGIIFPWALGEYLQRSTIVDVHNQNGLAYYIELIVESGISAIVAYLECVLIGTVITAVKAARHIPEPDKDYILILGCQVRKDGTLTPLLKGRADRAVWFAKMQKDETGKDIVFVPSGGKGADEAISEGEAIAAYLREAGIPEDRILTENRSGITEENFRNSMELIREHSGDKEPGVAFSTTNYHVLRSGQIALSQGISAEGVGSPTKSYFWINAFIREFVATLYAEKKRHITVVLILIAAAAAAAAVLYIAANS